MLLLLLFYFLQFPNADSFPAPEIGATPTHGHFPLITRAPKEDADDLIKRDDAISTLVIGPISDYMITSSYSVLPSSSSKSIVIPDPSATIFPQQGIDILIGGDLANSLSLTFKAQCQDINSDPCQQQITALLEQDDSLSLVARNVQVISLAVSFIVLYFAFLWNRLEQSTNNPIVGVHLPYSDYASMSSWTDASTVAFATTAGQIDAVTAVLTEGPLPTAISSPPTYVVAADGDLKVHLPEELGDGINLVLDQVICGRDLESQCTRIASEKLFSRLPLYPVLWQLAQVLGGFPLPTLSADITSLVNDVVTYAQGLNLGIDQTLLVGLATQFVFISNSRIKSKLINDYIVSTQSFEDTTECPPDDRTPYCQNCGGLPSDTIFPGDPAANLQFQGCSCLSRPFARPYTPFAKVGGLQVFINILSSLTTLPPPLATSTTQTASSSLVSSATPTPTPDITDTVTCFTRGDGKGANYLSGMNSKNPVTNLCFGADSSTDIKSGASWIPDCSLWWPASAGWPEWCNNGMHIFFNIPADAPPICQTPTPDRGTFCTTPLNSILAACPNLGGKVNNVCGEWAVQTCPLGWRCTEGQVSK